MKYIKVLVRKKKGQKINEAVLNRRNKYRMRLESAKLRPGEKIETKKTKEEAKTTAKKSQPKVPAKKFDPSTESKSWGAFDLGAAFAQHNQSLNEGKGVEAKHEVKFEFRPKVRKQEEVKLRLNEDIEFSMT